MRHRHRRDLGIGRKPLIAAHVGGEQAHRTVLAQIGHQHAQVDARASQPAFKGFATHLRFSRDLRKIEKCRIGSQDQALAVGDDKAIRHALYRLEEQFVRRAFLRACAAWRGRRSGHAQEKQGSVFLAEHRGGHNHGIAAERGVGARLVRLSGGAHPRHQRLYRPGAGFGESIGNETSDHLVGIAAEQLVGARVGFDNLLAEAVDNEERVGNHLEQVAVARFGLPQMPVVALHRLLGVDQPLLQRGHLAQVAPDRHDAVFLFKANGGKQQRHVCALLGCLVQMAPTRGRRGGGAIQERLDLGTAFHRDRLDPGLAQPFGVAFL